MTIHREGYKSIAITLLICILINVLTSYLPANLHWLKIIGYAFSVFLLVIILQFFRNPKVVITKNENHIISPADGKVVVVEEVEEPEYFKDKRLQVSIFMSPINVHVNRNPISGKVCYAKYHPGLYLVAWHPKSSTKNERTTVVYEHSNGMKILMRQIAGALARRIVFYVKEDDQIEQGAEMGFIKFGSRVDLFLPLGTPVNVKLNEAVKGGKTIIATIN